MHHHPFGPAPVEGMHVGSFAFLIILSYSRLDRIFLSSVYVYVFYTPFLLVEVDVGLCWLFVILFCFHIFLAVSLGYFSGHIIKMLGVTRDGWQVGISNGPCRPPGSQPERATARPGTTRQGFFLARRSGLCLERVGPCRASLPCMLGGPSSLIFFSN